MGQKVLLVENDPDLMRSAMKYLIRPDMELATGNDYSDALRLLGQDTYDGAIFNCFIPETAGSGQKELGYMLVAGMRKEGPAERRIRLVLDHLRSYVDVDDKEVRSRLSCLARANRNPMDLYIIRRLMLPGKERREYNTRMIDHVLAAYGAPPSSDHYLDLWKGIEASEDMQPLGLLLAKEAREKGIPCVLFASGTSSGPLAVIGWAERNGFPLVCNEREARERNKSGTYWTSVYDELRCRTGTEILRTDAPLDVLSDYEQDCARYAARRLIVSLAATSPHTKGEIEYQNSLRHLADSAEIDDPRLLLENAGKLFERYEIAMNPVFRDYVEKTMERFLEEP